MNLFVIFACLFATALSACSNPQQNSACPSDPARVQLTPRQITIAPGGSYAPAAKALICGGTQPIAFSGYWNSSNNSVARVDSLTGAITGVAAGSSFVYAHYVATGIGGNYDSIAVTVR